MSRLFSCFRSKPSLNSTLSYHRDVFFGLAKTPLQI